MEESKVLLIFLFSIFFSFCFVTGIYFYYKKRPFYAFSEDDDIFTKTLLTYENNVKKVNQIFRQIWRILLIHLIEENLVEITKKNELTTTKKIDQSYSVKFLKQFSENELKEMVIKIINNNKNNRFLFKNVSFIETNFSYLKIYRRYSLFCKSDYPPLNIYKTKKGDFFFFDKLKIDKKYIENNEYLKNAIE